MFKLIINKTIRKRKNQNKIFGEQNLKTKPYLVINTLKTKHKIPRNYFVFQFFLFIVIFYAIILD